MAKKAKKRKPQRMADARPAPELVPAQLRPRRALDYDLERQSEHMAVSAMRAAAPGMEYLLTRYPRKWLRKDVVAGVAVAADAACRDRGDWVCALVGWVATVSW